MSISFQLSSPRSAPTSDYLLQRQRTRISPRASIYDLDDDSLLNIFRLCRPRFFYNNLRGGWGGTRWWYKLVKVCQRWRYLIFDSPFHLDLCLLCTFGTPIAAMLAHSSPLPLFIDYSAENHDLTADDEEGIMLALQHRDRVRCIRLVMPVPDLQKLITAMNDEFPMLEYLHIGPPTKHDMRMVLPSALEAPNLRFFLLDHFISPIGSPLLTSVVGLVVLMLRWARHSTYPHPNILLETLSRMPQLQILELGFCSPVPKRDFERELSQKPITTRVTLPNLRSLDLQGISHYFEAIIPHVTCPLLDMLLIRFFTQLSFSVPWLPQFMSSTEFLVFRSAKFIFHHEAVVVLLFSDVVPTTWPPRRLTDSDVFVEVTCEHLDWQVSSVAQISDVLSPSLSQVVDLTLDYREHPLSSESHNQVDRILWRQLLGSFRNVNTLRVHRGLVGEVVRSLQSDGEPPLEVLPELKNLVCPVGTVGDKILAPFIHEREVACQPVNLIEESFPVGRSHYTIVSSSGFTYIDPDPDPLP